MVLAGLTMSTHTQQVPRVVAPTAALWEEDSRVLPSIVSTSISAEAPRKEATRCLRNSDD